MIRNSQLLRRLLLIDGCGLKGKSPALSAADSFLRSSIGGRWIDDEIQVLSGPRLSKADITQCIAALSAVDYSFLVCVGTTLKAKVDRPWAETYLVLSNGEKISERELNTSSSRLLMIFDGGNQSASLPGGRLEACEPDSEVAVARRKAAKGKWPPEQSPILLRTFCPLSISRAEFDKRW